MWRHARCSITTIDAVGARVLGMPWAQARRRQLLASRVDTTVAVVSLMRRLQKAPRVLVSASAVGFYGASPNASMEPLDETAPPRPGEFQSDLCAAIEHEARRAEALGVRVVRLRLGVVLGNGGGAYPLQALSARLGLGAHDETQNDRGGGLEECAWDQFHNARVCPAPLEHGRGRGQKPASAA